MKNQTHRCFKLALLSLAVFGASAYAQMPPPASSMPSSSGSMPASGSMPSSSNKPMMAPATPAGDMPTAGMVGEMDKMFFMKAAQSGMMEVKAGQLAQKRATDGEVKSFAKMMVSDHSKANAELKSLAMTKKVMLPTTLDAEHMAKLKSLQGMKKGKAFDAAYVDAMVDGHQMTVDLFKQASTGAEDQSVKMFATKTLPTLEQHLEMIKGIKNKM